MMTRISTGMVCLVLGVLGCNRAAEPPAAAKCPESPVMMLKDDNGAQVLAIRGDRPGQWTYMTVTRIEEVHEPSAAASMIDTRPIGPSVPSCECIKKECAPMCKRPKELNMFGKIPEPPVKPSAAPGSANPL